MQSALSLLEKYGEARAALSRVEPERAAELARLEEEIDLPYLSENHDRQFNSSSEGLQRIRAIVKNLRDFARLDEAESKDVDLNASLQTTLEALRHELNQKAIRVHPSLERLPPVSCHPGKINQVFLNILLNAIQTSPPEGPIEVRTRPEGETAVLVEIEDHGAGISPEHLPHLFEPFFTTKPVGSGMGLGLAVSYGIVRDHGGTLEAESSLGQGSTFRIRLPQRPPESG
jgi:signal transduction histidine kinase